MGFICMKHRGLLRSGPAEATAAHTNAHQRAQRAVERKARLDDPVHGSVQLHGTTGATEVVRMKSTCL